MTDEGFTYAMHLEVYLQAAVVRGVLATNQDRLSNFLIVRQGDEVFSIKDAMLETPCCWTRPLVLACRLRRRGDIRPCPSR